MKLPEPTQSSLEKIDAVKLDLAGVAGQEEESDIVSSAEANQVGIEKGACSL